MKSQTVKDMKDKELKIKMYCIYLQYGKDKPFLFEFNHSRQLTKEFYDEHQLYKPNYKIIKVEVINTIRK